MSAKFYWVKVALSWWGSQNGEGLPLELDLSAAPQPWLSSSCPGQTLPGQWPARVLVVLVCSSARVLLSTTSSFSSSDDVFLWTSGHLCVCQLGFWVFIGPGWGYGGPGWSWEMQHLGRKCLSSPRSVGVEPYPGTMLSCTQHFPSLASILFKGPCSSLPSIPVSITGRNFNIVYFEDNLILFGLSLTCLLSLETYITVAFLKFNKITFSKKEIFFSCLPLLPSYNLKTWLFSHLKEKFILFSWLLLLLSHFCLYIFNFINIPLDHTSMSHFH